MAISIGTMLRGLLLTLCIGYWLAALPTMAHGFVGTVFASDFASAGLFSATAFFHTLGLILLGAIFERTVLPWSLVPDV